jgi:hypothetical protein
MSRTQKRYAQLDRADGELREMLIPALEKVVAGRDTLLFVTKHNNPWQELRGGSQYGTQILERARAIVALAEQLGADTSPLLAPRVVVSFEGANDFERRESAWSDTSGAAVTRRDLHETPEQVTAA